MYFKQSYIPGQESDDAEKEAANKLLYKIIEKGIRLWPWLLVSALLCSALAYLYLSATNPSYKIRSSILVQDDKKGTDLAESQLLQDFGLLTGKSSVDNEAEIFKSRSLMEDVVKELNLHIHYLLPGKLKTSELFKEAPVSVKTIPPFPDNINATVTYELMFDKNRRTFKITSNDKTYQGILGIPIGIEDQTLVITPTQKLESWPENQPLIVTVNPVDATAQHYMQALNVEIPNKQVSVIYLTLQESLRDKGELILNTLTKVYLKANHDDKSKIADSTMDFIDKRLNIVSKELATIEKEIEGFKTTHKLTNIGEQSKLLLENTSEYARQLTALEVQKSVIDTLEQFLKENANKNRIVPSTLVMQDPNFLSLTEKYNTIQLQKDRMLVSHTASHPAIINLTEQLSNMRMEMLSSLYSIKKGLMVSIGAMQQKTNGFEQQISAVPTKERIFLDFERQQNLKQELYLFLMKKREETAISKSSTLANARIIDAAKADFSPFKPSRKMILMFGFIAGLIIPFGVSFGRDFLNNRISTLEDITSLTAAPVIGEIGHNHTNVSVAVTFTSTQLISEQFRTLRTNLQYLLPNANEKTLLVTSSMSGEGKSFLSINIGMSFALAGKKVLLLEMDLRKPKITQSLQLEKKGFTNFILDENSNWKNWIQPTHLNENFHFMSSGPIPPNPSELLLLPKVKYLFSELSGQYDYIIIDSPPVGMVTDAEILAAHANVTLYVVRQSFTLKQQMALIEKFFRKKALPKMNILMNDVELKTGYGYYGYGYGYGTYHAAEDGKVKKSRKKNERI